jgi:hypothetical protein
MVQGGGDVILVDVFALSSTYQNHDRIVNEEINENFFCCHLSLPLAISDEN